MSPDGQAKIPKKKAQLIAAARELVSSFGMRKLSIEEICRRAGTSKMTFYKYFPNKLALFNHIWSLWLEEALEYMRSIDALDIPFDQKLLRIIDYKVEFAGRLPSAAIDDLMSADPEMSSLLSEIKRRGLEAFSGWLAAAQERGEMRRMRPEFFLAVVDALQALARDGRLRALYPDYGDLVREINSLLFFGVMPQREGGRA